MTRGPSHLRRRLALALTLAAAALLPCALFLGAELYLLDGRIGFPLDDSWIHLAFADNLASGNGLALNPGSLVTGSTSPLWTALAAVGLALPGVGVAGGVVWMKALGVLFHLAGVVLTGHLARELGAGRALAGLAAVLAALAGPLVWSALSGMEISLFVALSLAGMVLHGSERQRPERPPLSLPVLGLAVLARPEGALLLILAVLDRLLVFERDRDGRLAWSGPRARAGAGRLGWGLALAALLILPVVAAYWVIGGSPLPTTFAVKTGGAGSGAHLPAVRYLHTAFGILFRPLPWMALLAPAGAMALVRGLGRPSAEEPRGEARPFQADRGLLPALWLAGLPLAYACLTPVAGAPMVGNFGRYLFPLLPVMIVLGVLALEPVAAAIGTGGRRRWLAAAAVALLFLPTVVAAAADAGRYARNVANIEDGDVAMARWLGRQLPADAVLATMDIGAMAALLPNPIVDLVGIADPEVQRAIGAAKSAGRDWQEGVLAFIAERRPDYLMIFPDWLPAVDRPGSPFVRRASLEVPGNITLGGDLLAVYSTPWTRYPLAEPASGRPAADRPPAGDDIP